MRGICIPKILHYLSQKLFKLFEDFTVADIELIKQNCYKSREDDCALTEKRHIQAPSVCSSFADFEHFLYSACWSLVRKPRICCKSGSSSNNVLQHFVHTNNWCPRLFGLLSFFFTSFQLDVLVSIHQIFYHLIINISFVGKHTTPKEDIVFWTSTITTKARFCAGHFNLILDDTDYNVVRMIM